MIMIMIVMVVIAMAYDIMSLTDKIVGDTPYFATRLCKRVRGRASILRDKGLLERTSGQRQLVAVSSGANFGMGGIGFAHWSMMMIRFVVMVA